MDNTPNNKTSFNICSYNCEGLARTGDYINGVLTSTNCDMMCLQETWLLDHSLCKLGDVHEDYLYSGNSGVDSSAEILRGRPYGGVAMLYGKSIAKYVKHVPIQHNRVTGNTLRVNSGMLLLVICVYLPCDNYSCTVVNAEYEHIINVIECTINSTICDAVIICGDFNTSFDRDNRQTRCLTEFMVRNNLRKCWDSPCSTSDYTYDNFVLNQRSCIDHFLCSVNVFDTSIVNSVLRDMTKEFTCDRDPLQGIVHAPEVVTNRRAWQKATEHNIDQYRSELDKLLSKVIIPSDTILCPDVMCTDESHRTDIDNLCSDMIQCCLRAGRTHVPSNRLKARVVPGWKDEVKPVKERSLFWHWLWLEAGKPNRGHIYDIMKRTRHQYHYAVRQAKQTEFDSKKKKLAACVTGTTDMWRELKKINPVGKAIPNTVDDACSPADIAELFVAKYEQLFTSVPTVPHEMAQLRQAIHSGIRDDSEYVKISSSTTADCMKKLKRGKSDGNVGFDSDHLINGTDKLTVMLTMLLNVMIRHGHTANDLLYSTIVSIPKDARASLCSSDNYRGIALCCSICKLIDLIIIKTYSIFCVRPTYSLGSKVDIPRPCAQLFSSKLYIITRNGTAMYSAVSLMPVKPLTRYIMVNCSVFL